MPPMWGHFLLGVLGLLLAGWYGRRVGLGATLASWLGFGTLWGALLPDVDVLVAKLVRVATLSAEAGAHIHRGPTHTFGLVALLLLVALAAALLRREKAGILFAGLAFGAAWFHIIPDTTYMDSVPVLWPFLSTDFGPYFVSEDVITDTQYNLVKAVDYLGEAFVYILTFSLARAAATANRFTRALPWFALADAVFAALLFAVATSIDRSTFHAIAGVPRTVFVVLTLILVPWMGRHTWLAFAAEPVVLGARPLRELGHLVSRATLGLRPPGLA